MWILYINIYIFLYTLSCKRTTPTIKSFIITDGKMQFLNLWTRIVWIFTITDISQIQHMFSKYLYLLIPAQKNFPNKTTTVLLFQSLPSTLPCYNALPTQILSNTFYNFPHYFEDGYLYLPYPCTPFLSSCFLSFSLRDPNTFCFIIHPRDATTLFSWMDLPFHLHFPFFTSMFVWDHMKIFNLFCPTFIYLLNFIHVNIETSMGISYLNITWRINQ